MSNLEFIKPNWKDGVAETIQYRTTIFTTRSGREQRSAERMAPRRTVEFTALLRSSNLRALRNHLHDRTEVADRIVDPARGPTFLAAAASSGATTFLVPDLPWWLTVGRTIMVAPASFATVTAIAPSGGNQQITIGTALAAAAPVGSKVMPTILGDLADTLSAAHVTDDVAEVDIRFDVLPGTPFSFETSPLFTLFDGLRVFEEKPNWAQPPQVQYVSPREQMEYGRGVKESYLPVAFNTQITQHTFLGRSYAKISRILRLFMDCKGRRGEFWSMDWTYPLNSVGGIASGTDTLFVDGPLPLTSLVNTAIAIRRRSDLSITYKKISAIEVTTEDAPGDFGSDYGDHFDSGFRPSVRMKITVDSLFDTSFTLEDIDAIYWMSKARFATDAMTVRWFNDDVAQLVAQVMTLETIEDA